MERERQLHKVLEAALHHPLPLELSSAIPLPMKWETFKKGDIILRPGEINKRLYFIQRGLVRAYFTADGVEWTMWMRGETEFVVSISSFYTQEPSVEYLHALEDTEVFSISYDEMWGLYRNYLDFALIGIAETQRVLREWNKRIMMLLPMDSTQRFEWFLKEHPNLVNRNIPGKYIATYLGMTPENFSKVKNRFFRFAKAG